jgi:hypothetical protein
VFDEVVGVVVRLVVVFGGHALNFVCNTGYVEIIMELFVADVPGALTMLLRNFGWNRCIIFNLVGLAQSP